MTGADYIGKELELFSHATRWKRYWQSKLAPYVRGAVAEIGAGIGANTPFFMAHAKAMTVTELDSAQCDIIRERFSNQAVTIHNAPLSSVTGLYYTICYIDVLEHIEDDRGELALAYEKLSPGGNLVILAPAHQWLFSPFDNAVGHYRRYNKTTLLALKPAGAQCKKAFYLDSVGCAASFANRILLGQSMPTVKQILLWDRMMVPLSRLIDPLLGFMFGKTVIVIFSKPAG